MGHMLKNRVAVITGSGNGLGRAEAIAMAAQGAKVIVNDLGTSHDGKGASLEDADRVVETIKKAGGDAVANYDSVAEEEGAKNIIQTAVKNFGRLDILVNNAGIIRTDDVWDIKTEDWDAMVKTHLYGTFFCTRAATAIMKEQGYGRIVCTSSHIGFGFFGQAAYSCVKEGITGFARTVARDMGKFGTTCNIIRPLAAWRGVVDKIGIMEENRPEDVASFVTYLVSEQAGNINGCIFEVFKNRVGIFTEPQPLEQVLWKDGRWTPEEFARVMPETLTRGKEREVYPKTLPYIFD
ncbi:MAG: SDR family NAD(P)-dependent oxidoreductase [Deltaproteobacteria bacterium]|nr:SDR family NAD(P)-dependent oxidoreductase [Deltaproteobacteria bacterium]